MMNNRFLSIFYLVLATYNFVGGYMGWADLGYYLGPLWLFMAGLFFYMSRMDDQRRTRRQNIYRAATDYDWYEREVLGVPRQHRDEPILTKKELTENYDVD